MFLDGADLSGANLTRANLTGANLTRANLTTAFLIETISNEATQWPEGFDLEAAGVIFE